MALGSQGVLIRRESSVAGTTYAPGAQTDIGFATISSALGTTGNWITRQAGFAGIATAMRLRAKCTSNDAVFTVVGGTAGTAIRVYETISATASGASITLTGHTMQNIGQVVSFNGPAMTANPIDTTDLSATAKTKIIGSYDGGQISLSVILDNEASNANLHLELEDDMRARTKRVFDVVFTESATTFQAARSAVWCEGYISGFTITGSVDNALKADLTLSISTEVHFINRVAT